MRSYPGVLRIVDANLNRAREAARCAEDYARFISADTPSARDLKRVRHELGRLSRRIPPSERNVPGDPLRAYTEKSEARRRAPDDAAAASMKRLEEALRSIEEFAKLVDASLSRAAKRLRFEAYRIEASLWASAPRHALLESKLYAVLSPGLIPGDPFRSAAEALRGGVDLLQLRCKGTGWPDGRVLALAGRLAALCRRAGAPFFLNDRPDLALACGADGVHLGQSDLRPAQARALVGRRLLLGVSTHTSRQVSAACRADIDYLAVGPMFPTPTKPFRKAVDLTLLGRIPAGAPPVFAIGGIDRQNLPSVLGAGARRIAVTGAVFRAPDIRQAARILRRALGDA